MEAVEISDTVKALWKKYANRAEDPAYGNWLLRQIGDGTRAELVHGLGSAKLVAEGEVWFVFELDGRTFRINGWASSYDGIYYDGELYEVKPATKTVTEYERVS